MDAATLDFTIFQLRRPFFESKQCAILGRQAECVGLSGRLQMGYGREGRAVERDTLAWVANLLFYQRLRRLGAILPLLLALRVI